MSHVNSVQRKDSDCYGGAGAALRSVFFRMRKDAACAVCLEDLSKARPLAAASDSDDRVQCCLLECGHSFCTACALELSKRVQNCPICGKKFYRRGILSYPDVAPNRLAATVMALLEALEKDVPGVMSSASDTSALKSRRTLSPSIRRPDVESPVTIRGDSRSGGFFSCADRASDADPFIVYNDRSGESMECYVPGTVVKVLPRLWPGMNRPGGVATILRVDPANGGAVDVKYLLDGSRDYSVPRAFVVASEELIMARTQRRRKQSPGSAVRDSYLSLPILPPRNSNENLFEAASSVRRVTGKKRRVCCEETASKLCILTTQCDGHQMDAVVRFAEVFGADIRTSFSPKVTHLVVDAAPDSPHTTGRGRILNQRTMKYLKCLAGGKWIVSFDWVTTCLRSNSIESEVNFEILMDAKSSTPGVPSLWRRIYWSQHTTSFVSEPRLEPPFKGICAVLSGGFPSPGPPKEDLAELLRMGGASLVMMLPASEIKGFSDIFAKHMKLLASLPIYIVSSDSNGADAFVKGSCGAGGGCISIADRAQFVNSLWVLDCISNCRRLDAGTKLYAV